MALKIEWDVKPVVVAGQSIGKVLKDKLIATTAEGWEIVSVVAVSTQILYIVAKRPLKPGRKVKSCMNCLARYQSELPDGMMLENAEMVENVAHYQVETCPKCKQDPDLELAPMS